MKAIEALQIVPEHKHRPEDESESERTTGRDPAKAWAALQQRVRRSYAQKITEELGEGTVLEPVCPKAEVQRRFLAARKLMEHELTVSYHGTKVRNIESISQRGLLVPGRNGNGIRVANGSAHGVGVYTARIGMASLSRGFCDSPTMFVCAVCDTSAPSKVPELEEFVPSATFVQSVFPQSYVCQGKTYGPRSRSGRQVTRQSDEVCHVGDAVVVFEESCVVPVFKATRPCEPAAVQKVDPAVNGQVAEQAREQPRWELPCQIGTRRLVVPWEEDQGWVRYGGRKQRRGEAVWIPPMPKLDRTSHERNVKRRTNRREWIRQRLRQRTLKEARLRGGTFLESPGATVDETG